MKLNEREQRVYKEMLEQPENTAVKRTQLTWAEEVHLDGEKIGEARGEARGMLKGAVLTLCDVLGIEVGPERQQALQALDLAELTALRDTLKRDRAWPPTLRQTPTRHQ